MLRFVLKAFGYSEVLYLGELLGTMWVPQEQEGPYCYMGYCQGSVRHTFLHICTLWALSSMVCCMVTVQTASTWGQVRELMQKCPLRHLESNC